MTCSLTAWSLRDQSPPYQLQPLSNRKGSEDSCINYSTLLSTPRLQMTSTLETSLSKINLRQQLFPELSCLTSTSRKSTSTRALSKAFSVLRFPLPTWPLVDPPDQIPHRLLINLWAWWVRLFMSLIETPISHKADYILTYKILYTVPTSLVSPDYAKLVTFKIKWQSSPICPVFVCKYLGNWL